MVMAKRIRTRKELMATGRASVDQRTMARKTMAITLCPSEDRPAKGGRRINRKKRKKAAVILKDGVTRSNPLY